MNILVCRTDKLGDFITALPTMYVLKHHNPNNRIIACVVPLNKTLAESCSFIDEVIIDDENSSIFSLAKKIKEKKIDASITLFSNTRIAIAQFLARISKRIAPATKIAQIFYTHRVKQRRSEVKMAEFEYNLELTTELFKDIKFNYPKPLLSFDDSTQVYDIFCLNHGVNREIIAFHLGFGGSSDANWNLDEYEVLIKEVLDANKYQVVLTFGPDELDLYKEMQDRLMQYNIIYYYSQESILYFAKLISKFKLFISTSTGTYHLASMLGTPTMTFFADSLFASSARWKSIGDEKLQQNFEIPSDRFKRDELFEKVKGLLNS
ncbi:glycosyltransferase family 9 protein [Sulfurimonas sp.]|uniref:glycosyltransferase family 9 protein n=1 Tax=Sulfurimonas sp. TaxID=2022749 RepID=UPI002B484AA7|nr:glycosyltransferase family 9 protein [Sulfurimonas sp.]